MAHEKLQGMKSLKEIEEMGLDALEAIARDSSIEVPESVAGRIHSTVAAGQFGEESVSKTETGQPRLRRYLPYAAAAAVAACLAIPVFFHSQQPKDTFEDPLMAYAELERTFSYISSKMDKGIEIASAAEPVIEKAGSVYGR